MRGETYTDSARGRLERAIEEGDHDPARSALERLGLAAEQRDATIDRVVRVAGYAMAAKYAVFSVVAANKVVHLSAYGIEEAGLEHLDLPIPAVLESDKPLIVQDFANDPTWRERVDGSGCRDAISCISYRICAADRVPIGALTILHNRPRYGTAVTRQIMEDLTDLIEESLIQRSLSIRDPLTHLFNRRYFNAVAESEWRRAQRKGEPISFAIVDIDHFKKFNDAAGHAAGDEALKRVAEVLVRSMRRAGDTVCRLGGEEFGVCLPVTPLETGRDLLDDVRKQVAALKIRHPAFDRRSVTISAGVATASTIVDFTGHDPAFYLELADQALYEAKRRGRNRVEVPR